MDIAPQRVSSCHVFPRAHLHRPPWAVVIWKDKIRMFPRAAASARLLVPSGRVYKMQLRLIGAMSFDETDKTGLEGGWPEQDRCS
jgi:hypothetical protein